jgi:two-component system phosphate regulon response regulator PhoB
MSKRVLIVDDEPQITDLVKLYLERSGDYQVEVENDSAQAMSKARQFGPDVIVLDIMMPEPDGSELAASLRADPGLRHVPILFLTALVSQSESCDPKFGFDRRHYLPKPINFEQLIHSIETAE